MTEGERVSIRGGGGVDYIAVVHGESYNQLVYTVYCTAVIRKQSGNGRGFVRTMKSVHADANDGHVRPYGHSNRWFYARLTG